jgi:hypothetical protein
MTSIHTGISMQSWGKDHWSVLLFVETRVVDYDGELDADRMRCIRAKHPQAYSAKSRATAFGSDADASKYPTRLKRGEAPGHDDYDCLADLIDEGLIVELADVLLNRPTTREAAADPRALWRLTPRGEAVSAALRAHRGRGGRFAQFEYEETSR